MKDRKAPPYKITYDVVPTPEIVMNNPNKHKVAVIRQEGSNGDREMLAALYSSGLEAWDVNMRDLIDAKVTLDKFRGIVFCGGFSYADVNGSAKGWAGVIQFNDSLLQQFKSFRDRPDTFTLGICNGCQLMALLGWVPFPPYKNNSSSNAINDGVKPEEQPRFIHNESHRFESRWSTVTIQPSPSVLLKGMEGSTLGIWVAHGEGRAFFPNQNHLQDVLNSNLAPLRYVDDDNNITQTYPFNPNGSPNAIAGMCSPCGRHLAMMPHPERCVNTWQWPYLPETMKSALAAGPWIKMFQNAKTFCDSNSL
jgi:phosphoribosylformylglycinamidine synthase